MIIDTTITEAEQQMTERQRWINFWNHPPEPGGIIESLLNVQNVTDELIAQGYLKQIADAMVEPIRCGGLEYDN